MRVQITLQQAPDPATPGMTAHQPDAIPPDPSPPDSGPQVQALTVRVSGFGPGVPAALLARAAAAAIYRAITPGPPPDRDPATPAAGQRPAGQRSAEQRDVPRASAPRRPRQPVQQTAMDHHEVLEEWDWLRDEVTFADFPARVGITPACWEQLYRRARDAGDPRARRRGEQLPPTTGGRR